MANTREIITLQFGNYSNYIGAHFWSIQESAFTYEPTENPCAINNDVLFRQGIANTGNVTYTPRLLLADLDGALKHLSSEGELYDRNSLQVHSGNERSNVIKQITEGIAENQINNDVELLESKPIEPHEYQKDLNNPTVNVHEKDYKLSESVESWADYLYSRYHPRTVNIIHEYKHMPNKTAFDTCSSGTELWSSNHYENDFCDKIRQYVEECDFLQGFQVIFDCDDGFSGLATSCIEHINDEYSKASFVLPVFQPRALLHDNADTTMSDTIRVVNSALCFSQLFESATMFTPLCTQNRVWRQLGSPRKFTGINYAGDNIYQTSGILAAYLETITLNYRLKDTPMTMSDFCCNMTNNGRKLTAAALALPFPMQYNEDLIDCLDKFEGSLFTQLTPNCKIGTDYVVQTLCMRGIPENRLKRPLEEAKLQMRMSAYKCTRVSEMLQLYLQCSNHASIAHVTATETPMSTKLPFPQELFATSTLNNNGFFTDLPAQERVTSAPVLAAVQCSEDLADTLDALHREAKRIKVNKLHRYKEAKMEADDYHEALEKILLFKDNYDNNFEL